MGETKISLSSGNCFSGDPPSNLAFCHLAKTLLPLPPLPVRTLLILNLILHLLVFTCVHCILLSLLPVFCIIIFCCFPSTVESLFDLSLFSCLFLLISFSSILSSLLESVASARLGHSHSFSLSLFSPMDGKHVYALLFTPNFLLISVRDSISFYHNTPAPCLVTVYQFSSGSLVERV
jgi:hypothetical protein